MSLVDNIDSNSNKIEKSNYMSLINNIESENKLNLKND